MSAPEAPCPLQSGDRIKSLHAGRLGAVVRTYADGSACVCWDNGAPQAEGLGHERVPANLLERVEAMPWNASPAAAPPCALRVLGDAMHPRFREGETVLLTAGYEPKPGDDVAVKTATAWLLREFVGIADGAVHLTAINEAYGACAIPLSEVASLYVVSGRVSTGRYIQEERCNAPGNSFVIRVRGDAMAPKYTPGNFAMVEPGEALDIGDDVFVRLHTGHTELCILKHRDANEIRVGSYAHEAETAYRVEDVSWIAWVAYPVPAKGIESRIKNPRKYLRVCRKGMVRRWKESQPRPLIDEGKGHKFCVLFMKRDAGGRLREVRSPWFSSRARAHQVLALMKQRYGDAIVYVD